MRGGKFSEMQENPERLRQLQEERQKRRLEDEIADLFAVKEDPDDTGSNKEFDEGEFGDEEFKHECPRCGFRYN